MHQTDTKVAWRVYIGKRELIGFSVHNGANRAARCAHVQQLFFPHTPSTGLSVLVEMMLTTNRPPRGLHVIGQWAEFPAKSPATRPSGEPVRRSFNIASFVATRCMPW